MNYLSNLSVARRLALGFCVVLLLSIGMIGVSISRLNAVAADTEVMVKTPIKTERLISDWYRNVRSSITRASAIARSSDSSLVDFFKEEQALATGNLIADVLDKPHDEANLAAVRAKVAALTRDFPVYR